MRGIAWIDHANELVERLSVRLCMCWLGVGLLEEMRTYPVHT